MGEFKIETENKVNLVAMTGFMGSGKTEALKCVQEILSEANIPHTSIKFAQPLYDLQAHLYWYIGKEEPVKDRKLLQFLGTDWGRSISPNLWVDIWGSKVLQCSTSMFRNTVLNDDCRFQNEADKVRELGGVVIRIHGPTRGDFISNQSHESEREIAMIKPDFWIYNGGDRDALKNNLRDALLEMRVL